MAQTSCQNLGTPFGITRYYGTLVRTFICTVVRILQCGYRVDKPPRPHYVILPHDGNLLFHPLTFKHHHHDPLSPPSQPSLMASHVFTRPRYAAIPTTAAVPPSFPSGTPTYLLLRHPGYPDEHNIMVSLPALDRAMGSSDDDGHRWGVHHTTALHVCSVVAANTTGVLSARKLLPLEAAPPLIDPDAVLTARSYYFYPHGWTPDDPPYPVCPDFANWRFPHDQLPDDWANVYVSRRFPSTNRY